VSFLVLLTFTLGVVSQQAQADDPAETHGLFPKNTTGALSIDIESLTKSGSRSR
jgi:hypothetical protein